VLTIVLKLTLSFLTGRVIGRFCAKEELSPILGIALTVACVLAICILVDVGLGNV
jgi:sorbitol-specific phosphotransferase system component IIBC